MLDVIATESHAADRIIRFGQRNAKFRHGHILTHLRLSKALGCMTFAQLYHRADLMHLFNVIPWPQLYPFVVTYESRIPRIPEGRKRALRRALTRACLSRHCKGVLAMSDWAVREADRVNQGIREWPAVRDRIQVTRPAVARGELEHRASGGPIRLLFVSQDCAGKMGGAVLRAVKALLERGVAVEATMVCRLDPPFVGEYYPAEGLHEYAERIRTMIGRLPVKHYEWLEYDDVRALMRQSDFLVHPTLHDTFGYVMAEAMAQGTPVIGTRVCAVPEIVVDGVSGYAIEMPQESTGAWAHRFAAKSKEYPRIYDDTEGNLARHIAELVASVAGEIGALTKLSDGAYETAGVLLNPEDRRQFLERLYQEATGGS